MITLANESTSSIPLADILASLSCALDLTEGQPMGHSQRSCLIGLKIGQTIGLSDADLHTLYLALLMKDAGCSSNSARMYEIFGSDEIATKRLSKITDWSNLVDAGKYALASTLPKSALHRRAKRLLYIVTHQSQTSGELMEARCDRGAQIALTLGLGEDAAGCIRALDEHWDGRGAPRHLKGEAIPLLARIACLAQTMEVFSRTFDLVTAYEIARKRSGKWFDPALVKAMDAFEDDYQFWGDMRHHPQEALRAVEAYAMMEDATSARIDTVCDAFSQIVDAKSHYTAEHSLRVCSYALEIAEAMDFSPERMTTMRRAALLHDLGKLAVPNLILDKAGALSQEEWKRVRQHPHHTTRILSRIVGFERIAAIAGAHHERLDGQGYPQGLDGSDLDQEMRILAVADVFDALSSARPYREALPLSQVFAIMEKDAGLALDRDSIEVLKERHVLSQTEMRQAA